MSYKSLPSRGAWIEIALVDKAVPIEYVAPLAGSVDRNFEGRGITGKSLVAPLAGSVDRNGVQRQTPASAGVAPLAGSVDRNGISYVENFLGYRRSPRGERG